MTDGPEVHEWYLGAERAGLVAVGIGPRAGAAEVQHLLRRTETRALVSGVEVAGRDVSSLLAPTGVELHLDAVAGVSSRVDGGAGPGGGAPGDSIEPGPAGARLGPDDLWLLNSTSGTTGLPKCVMHTQNRWMYFHRLAVAAGGLGSDDVFMSLLPTPFGFGLWTAHFTPTLLGAPVVLTRRFAAGEVLRLLQAHRVTVLACVTTQFLKLLNDPSVSGTDLSSLRVMFTGGEAVPYERAAEFEAVTGARVLQFYGSNETGALSRTSLTDSRARRLTTAGRVIEEMEVRLLDGAEDVTVTGGPGEPVCRGPATSLGYWNDDDANERLFTPDGWMHTGDLATLDAEGYLTIVGRLSDIIIRGGKNISAAQVEGVLMSHPDVDVAAAVAMPDPVMGEKVCAYVVPAGAARPTLDELIAHMLSRGAGKELLPEYLVLLDSLPIASGGKVAKARLREDVRRRLGDE
jgi:acyl-CoA synthetase